MQCQQSGDVRVTSAMWTTWKCRRVTNENAIYCSSVYMCELWCWPATAMTFVFLILVISSAGYRGCVVIASVHSAANDTWLGDSLCWVCCIRRYTVECKSCLLRVCDLCNRWWRHCHLNLNECNIDRMMQVDAVIDRRWQHWYITHQHWIVCNNQDL